MLKASVTFDTRDLERSLADFVKEVADETFRDVQANTPVRSGNARRHWTKDTTSKSFEVKNQVPYIGKLEAGASRQAPRGILGPTLTQVRGKFK